MKVACADTLKSHAQSSRCLLSKSTAGRGPRLGGRRLDAELEFGLEVRRLDVELEFELEVKLESKLDVGLVFELGDGLEVERE